MCRKWGSPEEYSRSRLFEWAAKNKVDAFGIGSPWTAKNLEDTRKNEHDDLDLYYAGRKDMETLMDKPGIAKMLEEVNRDGNGTFYYLDNETPKSHFGHLWYVGFVEVVPSWHDYDQDFICWYSDYDNGKARRNKLTGDYHKRRTYCEVIKEQRDHGALAIWAHPTSWWTEDGKNKGPFVTNIATEMIPQLMRDGYLDGMTVMGYDAYHEDYENLWFALLDLGYRVPGFAELDISPAHNIETDDTMLLNWIPNPKRPLTLDYMKQEFRAAHHTMSSGPRLYMKVDGQLQGAELETGKGKIHTVEVFAWPQESEKELSRVQLLGRKGEIIAEKKHFKGGRIVWQVEGDAHGGYLVARVFGQKDGDYNEKPQQQVFQCALTNPVWLRTDLFRAPAPIPAPDPMTIREIRELEDFLLKGEFRFDKRVTKELCPGNVPVWAFQIDKVRQALERTAERRHDYYFNTTVPVKPAIGNSFIDEPVTTNELPDASAWENDVPTVFWDGHDDVAEAFSSAWQMVGSKLHSPEKNTNFKRNFVYTPFGESVFVWGSCFITMYGKYAANIFPFIEQLDNFYAVQEPDGFIPRQLGIYDGRSQFAKSDLSSVGGVIFSWAEMEWFKYSGDISRLRKVYPVLLAYHRWCAKYRTWKDGTYFSSGWGCGMDNIPRIDIPNYRAAYDHGHLSYVDCTLQQIFDAKNLISMSKALDINPEQDLVDEIGRLTAIANTKMWDEQAGIYKDLVRDGSRAECEHIGGFWSLLAGIADVQQIGKMIQSLNDKQRFAAPCGTRSLSKSSVGYNSDGGNYWQGGVWPITDYMIVKGLDAVGREDVAYQLARRQVEAFAKVYSETGTIWECYDPERVASGKLYGSPVRKNFVGFSGVSPIAMLLEDVFGIHVEGGELKSVNPRLTDHYGIRNLTLPNGRKIDIEVMARKSEDKKPEIRIHEH